jgi:hypothetical protein
MVSRMNLDLIIAQESIHKGKNLMAHASNENLVDKRHEVIIFGTILIKITKISIDLSSTLFFVNRDTIGHPCGILNWTNETNFLNLVNFNFNGLIFGRMDRNLFLLYWRSIGPCINVILYDGGINPQNFKIRPCKNVTKLLQREL